MKKKKKKEKKFFTSQPKKVIFLHLSIHNTSIWYFSLGLFDDDLAENR